METVLPARKNGKFTDDAFRKGPFPPLKKGDLLTEGCHPPALECPRFGLLFKVATRPNAMNQPSDCTDAGYCWTAVDLGILLWSH